MLLFNHYAQPSPNPLDIFHLLDKDFLREHYADEEISANAYKDKVVEIPTNLIAATKLLGLEFLIPKFSVAGRIGIHDPTLLRSWDGFLRDQAREGSLSHAWLLDNIDQWTKGSWW